MAKELSNKIFRSINNFFIHLSHSIRRISYHIFISLKQFTRSPSYIFLLLIFPIILLLLFGSIFATDGSDLYHLEVQDKDMTILSESLVTNLEDTELLEVHRLDPTVDSKEYMQQNDLYSCLVIPANWTIDTLNPSVAQTNVTLIINPYSSSAQQVVKIVTRTIQEFSMNISDVSPIISIQEATFYSEAVSYIDFFIPGIVGIIIMNTALLGTLSRQSYFKYTGLFRKLATTPITRWEFAFAEICWQFIISFMSILITMLMAWLVFDFSWISFDELIPIIVFIGTIEFSGIGLLTSQIVRNPNYAFAVGFLISIPLIFLSGVFFDISGIRALVVLSKFSPLTYLVEALRASMILRNFSYAWINIAIAFTIGIITFVVGVFLTHWYQDKKQ